MITQELVAFIKQQLQEGKSKEQIATILTPHGWELADINTVFAQLMPSTQPMPTAQPMPSEQPVMQPTSSAPVSQIATEQMTTVAATTTTAATTATTTTTTPTTAGGDMLPQQSGFFSFIKNPSSLIALITIVIATLSSTLLMSLVAMKNDVSGLVSQNVIIGIILGIIFVGIIFSGLVTQLITKIVSISNRTFAKAFVFAAVGVFAGALFSLLGLIGISQAVPIILGLGVWIGLFMFFYETSIWKTIVAFLLNMVVSGIIALALFLGISVAGIGLLSGPLGGSLGKYLTPNAHMSGLESQMQAELQMQAAQQELDAASQQMMSDITTAALVNEATNIILDAANESDASLKDIMLAENPDYSHVKDAFPAGFPLPKNEDIISAAVLSASTYEGVRYILEYTSTNSLAYLRNNLKTSLEKAGYSYAINEKDSNYRVITATQVVRDTVRSFRIELQQTGQIATVRIVFSQ